jgi:Phage integrase family
MTGKSCRCVNEPPARSRPRPTPSCPRRGTPTPIPAAATPATWNRNRGAVTAWLSWCAASRLAGPVLPASAERRREHLNAPRAVPRPAIERVLSRRDVPLREKTLWRMLYETAARASEVLALNIEDLDLDARRAPVRSKGGDTEWICWGSGTAHLLPRLIRAARPDRYSSPSAVLAPPAARRPRTCVPSPDGPGSAMTAPGSCSPGTPGGVAPVPPLRSDPPRRARHPLAADHGQDPAPQPAHRDAIRPPRRRSRR